MRLPTWSLVFVLLVMALASLAMAGRATRRLAFESSDGERLYWVGRMKVELPSPAKVTMWNIYRCRPEKELRECLASDDPALFSAAAEALWNIWSQALGPENESRLNEAHMLFEDGLTTQALTLAEALAQELPEEAEVYSLRGRIRLRLGNYEEGIDDCKTALTLNEWHWPTLRSWVHAAAQRGDQQGQIEALERLSAIFPHDKALHATVEKARGGASQARAP